MRSYFLTTALTLAAFAISASPSQAEDNAHIPASYMKPDGRVVVVGNDGLEKVLVGIASIVERSHPGLHYDFVLKGSSTGLPALAANATLFAPLTREARHAEISGFKQARGYEPVAVQIGYSGWGPRPNGKTPTAVYVSRSNVLASISMDDLSRVFSSGNSHGDLNLWGQLGEQGEASGRRIHLYGLHDDGSFATALRERLFDNHPYATRYEPLGSYASVLKAVSTDPYGIAIVGWVKPSDVPREVRLVPIKNEDGTLKTPARQTVASGSYPLSSGIYFYIDKAPGKPLDPLVRAWVDAALSREGQAVIAAQANTVEGYLPLASEDLSRQQEALKSF
ncbi:substrate-binding domain-containing protein [Gluconobacter frateurii]|uniref:PstS family phosphate ABC transporter substrate-binding protein n=1 Tax=Gluconobacter frateurii TaxID=38308 RepID=UPI001F06E32F|nr:substrate-binding domain-containing protein [Gluconobacter frateurii]UMM07876.1 substrate-binding domain-containing protein [Gluconobacter frateurii]